jgi:hypothetical protein
MTYIVASRTDGINRCRDAIEHDAHPARQIAKQAHGGAHQATLDGGMRSTAPRPSSHASRRSGRGSGTIA